MLWDKGGAFMIHFAFGLVFLHSKNIYIYLLTQNMDDFIQYIESSKHTGLQYAIYMGMAASNTFKCSLILKNQLPECLKL